MGVGCVQILSIIHPLHEQAELRQLRFHDWKKNEYPDQVGETHRKQRRIGEIDHIARSHHGTDNDYRAEQQLVSDINVP